MTIPVEVLEAEVLSLPAPLRSRLLDKLIASLDTDPEWEEAWAAEADRREAAIASGQESWVPGDAALARARAKLA
jgi:Putative addiction module component